MAKKKKKGGKKAGAANVTHIDYLCAATCSALQHKANIGPRNSVVVLSAIGTKVKIKFGSIKGSPLKGRRTTISIGADRSKHVKVDANATNGNYPYTLTCDACTTAPGQSGPPAPPEMIVP